MNVKFTLTIFRALLHGVLSTGQYFVYALKWSTCLTGQVKGKAVPLQACTVPEGWPAACTPLPPPPRKYSWYSFLLRGWVDHRAIVRPERLCQWKNYIDTIRNRTRDLPTCGAVPQPNALPRTPCVYIYIPLWLKTHKGKGWSAVNNASPTHRPPLPPGNIPGTHFC